jgi:hypothetical protein
MIQPMSQQMSFAKRLSKHDSQMANINQISKTLIRAKMTRLISWPLLIEH